MIVVSPTEPTATGNQSQSLRCCCRPLEAAVFVAEKPLQKENAFTSASVPIVI